jgi:hypothetical protein
MNRVPEDYISLPNEDDDFETLQKIEKLASEDARQQRAHERIAYKSKVILQPGNSSDFLGFKVQGIIGNISNQGCQAMFPIPLEVGDMYRMRFEKESLDVPLMFVRCLRCRLVSENEFETGFSFFGPITLPQDLISNKKPE